MSRTIGFNTAGLGNDYAALATANAVEQAGFFNGFGSNPSPGYDSNSYPLYVNGTTGPTQTQILLNAIYPAGTWTFSGDGVGTVQLVPQQGAPGFDGQGTRTINLDGSGTPISLNIAARGGGVGTVCFLRITASNQANHVRNLKLMIPDATGKAHDPARIFSQQFLDFHRGAKSTRHLDWLKTNGTTIINWNQTARQGSGFGFPIRGRACEEYCVAFANEMQQYCGETLDLWTQLPHFATPAYWQGLRDLIQDGGSVHGHTMAPLNAASKVIVEFSNETDFGNWSQRAAMDAQRLGADAAVCATWNATYGGKPITYTVNGHTVTKNLNPLGTNEYIAHLKAYAQRKFKELFADTDRTVLTAVMNQGGVPFFGQLSIDHFHAPNLRDGGTTEIDILGHGLYAGAKSGPFQNMDLTPLAASYATNDPTQQEAAKARYFAGFPQFFADFNPLTLQYRNMAAFIGAIYAIYEFGVESSSFAYSGTVKTQLQAFLKACFRDDRMQPIIASMLDSFGPDAGPCSSYWDVSTSVDFHWSAAETAPPNLAISPIIRALRADMGTALPPVNATGYTLSATPSTAVVGTAITIRATLAGGTALASPLVITLSDSLGSTASGAITIGPGSTTATASITASEAGAHAISASHTGGGFAGNDGSTSFTATSDVTDATGYTLTVTPPGGVLGATFQVTASLTGGTALASTITINLDDSLDSTISGPITIADGSTSGSTSLVATEAGDHALAGTHTGGFTGGDDTMTFSVAATGRVAMRRPRGLMRLRSTNP